MSADWWHIDMRDIVTALGAQTIILENPPPNNGASTVVNSNRGDNSPWCWCQPERARASRLHHRSEPNLSGAVFEGLDYEAIYILDSTVFGGSDWGRITTTINGTWLSRAEFQAATIRNALASRGNSCRRDLR